MKYTGQSVKERKLYKNLVERVRNGDLLSGKEKRIYDDVTEFYKSGVAQRQAGVRDLAGVGDSIANKTGKDKNLLQKILIDNPTLIYGF